MAADVTGTINFGSASGSTNVNTSPKTGNDSQGNEWTITTVGTTSFTPNAAYAQIGSSSKPATSITFTTTLASEQTITAFSAKFGGFSNTAGTITLKVGDTTVGSGSLNGTTDVIVNATNTTTTGTVLTVTVTGISKGVKAYYISYTYPLSDDAVAKPTIAGETPFLHTTTVTLDCATEGATIRYTTDGADPTSTSTLYENPFELSATTTVKAKAFKNEDESEIASKEFVKATVWTVAEANAALDEATPLADKYVHGIISQIDNFNSGAITYWISDDGTTSGQLEVYRGKNLNGANFSSIDDLQLGDIVTVYGTLKVYNTTKEFDVNNKIVEFERPAVDLPKIEILGDWDDFTKHELTPAANNKTASYTVELTEVKDYQFAFIYEGSSYYLPTDKITRAANEAECDGTSGNATIEADQKGEYTFTWTYETNTVTVTYPALPTGVFELYTGEIGEGKYLITYDNGAMNTTVTSNRIQFAEIEPINNCVKNPDPSIVWYIESIDEYWTLYNEEAKAYAAATGSKNQAQMLNDGTDDKAKWTVTVEDGKFEFENKARAAAANDADKKWLRKNGAYGFATYASSTGGALTLFKYRPGPATSVDNTDATKKAVKFIQNGQLFIEMNGRIYNVQGQVVK